MKKFLFPVAAALVAVLICSCSPASSPASDNAPVVQPPAPPVPVLSAPFSVDVGSFYWGQGTAGTDNGTIKTQDGSPGLYINGAATDEWGTIGVAFQEDLTDVVDFSGQDFVLSFDLWLPADSKVTFRQFEILDGGYTGIYSNDLKPTDGTTTPDGAWHSYSVTVNEAAIGWDAFKATDKNLPSAAGWTALSKARLIFKTAVAGDLVVAYVKNWKISR